VPQSDSLIDPAIAYFGWDAAELRQDSPAIAAVLRRRRELRIAAELSRPGHPLHGAWASLQRPLAWPWLMRFQSYYPAYARQVRTLLLQMQDAPGLSLYLRDDRVAWWRSHLVRPRPEQALPMIPIVWLLLAALLTAIQGRLIPNLRDAQIAAPLSVVATLGYWFVMHRRGMERDRTRLAGAATWMGASAQVLIPLLALMLPLGVWTLGLLTVMTGLALCLEDYALLARPPASAQRVDVRYYYMVLVFGVLAAAWMEARGILAAAVVAAAALVGWYRGRATLPAYLAAMPLRLRLLLPIAFMTSLGLAYLRVRQDSELDAYRLFIGVILAWVLLRMCVTAEARVYVRSAIGSLGGIAIFVLLFGMLPQFERPGDRKPDTDQIYQPTAAEREVDPPPHMGMEESPPRCPTPAQDKRNPSGMVDPLPCGTVAQWLRGAEYPRAAWYRRKSGEVWADVGIDPDGMPSSCFVSQSSGSVDLDDGTCRLLKERARFLPARDAFNNHVVSAYRVGVVWTL
jgi:TonB family protein